MERRRVLKIPIQTLAVFVLWSNILSSAGSAIISDLPVSIGGYRKSFGTSFHAVDE